MIELASEFVGDLHMERSDAHLVFVTDGSARRDPLIEAALVGQGFDVLKVSSLAEAARFLLARPEADRPLVDLLLVSSDSALDFSAWESDRKALETLAIRGLNIGNNSDISEDVDTSLVRFDSLAADRSTLRNCVSWATSTLADARWDASFSDSAKSFYCPLDNLELADLLFEISGKARDATVIVQSEKRVPLGRFEFSAGTLVHAETTFHSGRLAALQLLSLNTGYAQVAFSRESEKQTVASAFADIASLGLVLRALKIKWQAMPGLSSSLVVDIAGLTEKLGLLPDDANTLVRACSGQPSFAELLESLDLDETRIFGLVSFLLDEGVLSTKSDKCDFQEVAVNSEPENEGSARKKRRRSPTARHFPSPPVPSIESKPRLELLTIDETKESTGNRTRKKNVTPTWTGTSDPSFSPPTGSLPIQLKQKRRLESAETLLPPGMDSLPASSSTPTSKDAQGAVSSQGAARAELAGEMGTEGEKSEKEMKGGTLQMAILSSVVVSEETNSESEILTQKQRTEEHSTEARASEQRPSGAANDENSPLHRIARASSPESKGFEHSVEEESPEETENPKTASVSQAPDPKENENNPPEAGKAIFLFSREPQGESSERVEDGEPANEEAKLVGDLPQHRRFRSSWVAAAAALFAGSLTVAALAIPQKGDEDTSIRATIVLAIKEGQKQKAIELLSTLPAPTAADLTQGVELLYETSRQGEALAAADRLLELHPGQARAWLAKGLIYYQRKDYLRASSALRRYLALSPAGENPDRVRSLLENTPR